MEKLYYICLIYKITFHEKYGADKDLPCHRSESKQALPCMNAV